VQGGASDLARPHPHLQRPAGFAARELAGELPLNRTRRQRLALSFASLQRHEQALSAHLLEGLGSVPGLRIYGITDPKRLEERVPTFSFTLEGQTAEAVATRLGERGIYCWAGNFYALSLVERLGLEASGGLVRVGAVHYNTLAEIDVLVAVLREMVASPDSAPAATQPSPP
jgi:selenocysteine lyase/cysteine desulfurase